MVTRKHYGLSEQEQSFHVGDIGSNPIGDATTYTDPVDRLTPQSPQNSNSSDLHPDYLAFVQRRSWWDERAKTVQHGCDSAATESVPLAANDPRVCAIGRHQYPSERRALKEAIKRCHSISNKDYKDYGLRGIRVCEEWRGTYGFEEFLSHIGPKPSSEHTLDRVDTNGDYRPGNVRWATWTQQANNRRSSRVITWRGETRTAAEWARKLGVRRQEVANRLNKGEPPTLVLCQDPTDADLFEAAAEFIEASHRKSSGCGWKPKLIDACKRAQEAERAWLRRLELGRGME
jgi:hypothetical protein